MDNAQKLDAYINEQYGKYKDHEGWFNVYTVTITPVGKNKTHEDTMYHFNERVKLCKSVKNVILVREDQVTNHFHGLIISTQDSKLLKLYAKSCYTLDINIYNNINDHWCKYMYKHNPTSIDFYAKKNGGFVEMDLN